MNNIVVIDAVFEMIYRKGAQLNFNCTSFISTVENVWMKLLKILAEFSLIAAKQFSLLSKILIAVSVGVAFAIILMGIKVDPIYYWGLLILLPLIILNIRVYQKNILQKLVCQLREDWGKQKATKRNFLEMESFYRYFISQHGNNGIFKYHTSFWALICDLFDIS